jgi:hypothetical protein
LCCAADSPLGGLWDGTVDPLDVHLTCHALRMPFHARDTTALAIQVH